MAVPLLDEDGRVRVEAKAGEVVLRHRLVLRHAAGVKLVLGEALLVDIVDTRVDRYLDLSTTCLRWWWGVNMVLLLRPGMERSGMLSLEAATKCEAVEADLEVILR